VTYDNLRSEALGLNGRLRLWRSRGEWRHLLRVACEAIVCVEAGWSRR